MNKILFLHGFFATGSCPMATALKEAFLGQAIVLTPDLPLHPKEALGYVRTLIDKEKPDLIIGNSCGAFLAQMIASVAGIPALLGNPHFKMTDFLKQRIGELMEQRGQSRACSGYAESREKKTEGQHVYKAPRKDGNQKIVIDEALINEFEELEAIQFDGCNPTCKNKVWGLFGEKDTLAHFEPLFLQLYNNSFHFPGGHTPTDKEVKAWYVPLAQKMLAGGRINRLALAMIDYNNGDPKRIQHTTKVHAYASLIGKCEGLDEETQFILESAALLHDVGIRASEQKYGHQNGKLQEQEGPAVAREMLTRLGGYTDQQIERICWLVAHHHTYHACEDLDYQILIEADFLVNLYEDDESANAIRAVRRNIFRTESGIRMLETMFGINEKT